MHSSEDKYRFTDHNNYYDGYGNICPICGGKIIHPYTGLVTSEQLDEESKCCIWGEVIDEGDSTIGYVPQCKRIHPYTLESENHEYIHYDLVELANSWDMPFSEKIEKLFYKIKEDLVSRCIHICRRQFFRGAEVQCRSYHRRQQNDKEYSDKEDLQKAGQVWYST